MTSGSRQCCKIYCHNFFTLSNQTSRYIRKCIRIKDICSVEGNLSQDISLTSLCTCKVSLIWSGHMHYITLTECPDVRLIRPDCAYLLRQGFCCPFKNWNLYIEWILSWEITQAFSYLPSFAIGRGGVYT